MHDKYDAVVIGGGHNGLVAAAYLGKAGKRVALIERNRTLGGCSSTDDTSWPGYKISSAAYVISLFQPKIIKELELKDRYGLTIIPRNPSSFTPDLEGPGLVLGNHPNGQSLTHTEISRYSKTDAESFSRYEKHLENIVKKIEPIIEEVPFNLQPFKNFSRLGVDLSQFLKTSVCMASLGSNLPHAFELFTGAATPILDRWFESDILKATLATDAIIGTHLAPSQKGSAYVLLHHVMGEAGGARGVWGYVQSGMGGLADALELACIDAQVDILKKHQVTKIMTNYSGRAVGVTVEYGAGSNKTSSDIKTDVVVSSLDCNLTFFELLKSQGLSQKNIKKFQRIDYTSASLKMNLALDKLPKFRLGKEIARDFNPLTGTIHIPNTMQAIESAYADSQSGKPSECPILEMSIPSTVDPTVAPAGKHIMGIFIQYAPYQLNDHLGGPSGWDSLKDEFGNQCVDIIEEHAPGFKDSIIHRQIITPLDLEKKFGLTQGNIFQGAMKFPMSMGPFRPIIGYADHRTPIKGLYLCGAATHPGGGVMGICGKNAALEILKDL